jgi:hypothetical protein
VHAADCVTTGRAAATDSSAKTQPARTHEECMVVEILRQKISWKERSSWFPGKIETSSTFYGSALSRVSHMLHGNLIIF